MLNICMMNIAFKMMNFAFIQSTERISVLNNMAMVYYKMEDYDESRKMSGRVRTYCTGGMTS